MGRKGKGPLRKGRCELNPEQPGGSQVKPGQAETTWHVKGPGVGTHLQYLKDRMKIPVVRGQAR